MPLAFLGSIFSFFTSRTGFIVLAVFGTIAAIWGGIQAFNHMIFEIRKDEHERTVSQLTIEAQEHAAQVTRQVLEDLRANDRRQTEIIQGLQASNISRARQLDRISQAVQETIIEQGGEQIASPALRQSAQLLAAEWDRLYANKVEATDAPSN